MKIPVSFAIGFGVFFIALLILSPIPLLQSTMAWFSWSKSWGKIYVNPSFEKWFFDDMGIYWLRAKGWFKGYLLRVTDGGVECIPLGLKSGLPVKYSVCRLSDGTLGMVLLEWGKLHIGKVTSDGQYIELAVHRWADVRPKPDDCAAKTVKLIGFSLSPDYFTVSMWFKLKEPKNNISWTTRIYYAPIDWSDGSIGMWDKAHGELGKWKLWACVFKCAGREVMLGYGGLVFAKDLHFGKIYRFFIADIFSKDHGEKVLGKFSWDYDDRYLYLVEMRHSKGTGVGRIYVRVFDVQEWKMVWGPNKQDWNAVCIGPPLNIQAKGTGLGHIDRYVVAFSDGAADWTWHKGDVYAYLPGNVELIKETWDWRDTGRVFPPSIAVGDGIVVYYTVGNDIVKPQWHVLHYEIPSDWSMPWLNEEGGGGEETLPPPQDNSTIMIDDNSTIWDDIQEYYADIYAMDPTMIVLPAIAGAIAGLVSFVTIPVEGRGRRK